MIAALLPAILPAVTDIVGRFLPEDKEERAKAERKIEAELASHLAKVDLAQMSINKEEAKSGNVFHSRVATIYRMDMRYSACMDICGNTDFTVCISSNRKLNRLTGFGYESNDAGIARYAWSRRAPHV